MLKKFISNTVGRLFRKAKPQPEPQESRKPSRPKRKRKKSSGSQQKSQQERSREKESNQQKNRQDSRRRESSRKQDSSRERKSEKGQGGHHKPRKRSHSGQGGNRSRNQRHRGQRRDYDKDFNQQDIEVIPEKPKEIPPMPEIKEAPEAGGKLRFTDLPIKDELKAATQDLGFQYCTPIQQQSLPHALEGNDITGKAQTGTGKTAAFLIAVMNHLLENPSDKRYPGTTRSLILAPTRELALQVAKDANSLAKYTNLNIQVFFGGMHHKKQRQSLSKPIDILIGTPGRLIDYVKSRNLFLADTELLVIDEADRMLDMGFIPDVRYLVRNLPSSHQRRTMFYSATFDQRILRLVKSWLNNPVNVEIESEELVTDLIEQRFYSVMSKDKFNFLFNYINKEDFERIIVFVNRKDSGYSLHRSLKAKNIGADLLSGDVPQHKRIKVLERLRSGEVKILIATDVAARGIHIDNISHVINYDLPEKTEDYVHRIGRTGRAGRKGKSISLVCESGAFVIGAIEEYVGESFRCEQPPSELLEN